MKSPVLKDWSIGWPPLALNFKAPIGLSNICVRGVLYKSEKDKKGTVSVLDGIVFLDTERKVLKTQKLCFLLGEPSAEFLTWLKEMKINLSEYNTVT